MRIAWSAALAGALGLALTGTAHARGRADLVESRLGDPPARLAAARPFVVTDIATNRGAGRSARSVTRYYLRSGKTSLLAGSRRVPALGRGARSRSRVRLKVPRGAPGVRFSVVACVDATHRVRERNEHNNCRVSRGRLVLAGPHGAASGSLPTGSSADSDRDGSPDSVDCAPHDGSAHPGAHDDPDLGFVDSNCDGIDGNAARAVFVSPSGNDASAGTMAAPLRTLAAAVALADADDRDVYAAAGTYAEELRVASRVSVYGGYTPSWRRSASAATRILGGFTNAGDSEGAVALNVSAATTLQLLTLQAPATYATGAGSYGLRAVHSSGLRLERLSVTAAGGAQGATGAAGAPGLAGGDGAAPGPPGFARGGTSPIGHVGGQGGYGGEQYSGNGGQPGWSLTPDGLGLRGGRGGMGGAGGSGHTTGDSGETGDFGRYVDGGGHGAARGDATFGSGLWHGYAGAPGSPGSDGHGGGGGGGGGADDCFTCGDVGGFGGGGGGGGQGGRGGQGGGPGGGSFGLFLTDSSDARVRDCTITAANGGAGGAGGAGGQGGAGGAGGAGDEATGSDGSPGGAGGHGGAGGPGGNGGGGAGGPSAAIAGLTSDKVTGTTLRHGAGGVGGGGDLSATTGIAADYLVDAP